MFQIPQHWWKTFSQLACLTLTSLHLDSNSEYLFSTIKIGSVNQTNTHVLNVPPIKVVSFYDDKIVMCICIKRNNHFENGGSFHVHHIYIYILTKELYYIIYVLELFLHLVSRDTKETLLLL